MDNDDQLYYAHEMRKRLLEIGEIHTKQIAKLEAELAEFKVKLFLVMAGGSVAISTLITVLMKYVFK